MPIIKRYPNRKLYDTEAKQYITLDGIAALIRDGQDVQVIDHASGDDLTALTLTQIIFEQEKQHSGLLPLSMLNNLIRSSGDRLHSLQQNFFSSTFWQQIDEEIKHRVQSLIKLGEMTEEEGKKLLSKLMRPEFRREQAGPEPFGYAGIDTHQVEEYLQKQEVPTKDDLQQLHEQLEILSTKLEELSPPE